MVKTTTTKGNRIISWVLRVFLLAIALLFLLFSLDVFGTGRPLWEVVAGFFIHNIFTFALLIILFIAWKRENLAGMLLVAIGIFMIFFFGGPSGLMYGTWIMIGLPVLVGIIFICNYYLISNKDSQN